jgi:K(+)-stimulated pyrophosphate-energized sodium pump
MAADLFESYEVTLVASIILGVAAFNSVGANPALGLVFPLAARAIGVVASIAGVFAVKAKEGETNALKPINKGFLVAGTLTLIGTLIVALAYVGNDNNDNAGWKCFGAVAIGLVLAQLVSRLTEYYTGTHYRPVKDIADASETGPATVVLAGTASGMESSVYAVVAIAIAIGVSLASAAAASPSRCTSSPCAVWACSPPPVIVSEDTFGPVSDNAAGIAEMSGEFTVSRRRSWSPSARWATPPRPSPRASPSVRRSSPPWPCSPASSRPPATSSTSSPAW